MNNKVFQFLKIRYINQFGISKINDNNSSIRTHARITLIGYITVFILVIGYFLSLPISMQQEGLLNSVNSYVVGLLFWGITIWTCLSGVGDMIVGKDHDYIFTLPLKEFEAKTILVLYQYIIQEVLVLIVLFSVQISMMIIHQFPIINLLVILLVGICIPIISIILNSIVSILVNLFFATINLKFQFLKTLLIFSIIIFPLVISYLKSGIKNPKIGIINASFFKWSLTRELGINQWLITIGLFGLTMLLLILFILFLTKKYEKILYLIGAAVVKSKEIKLHIQNQFISLFKDEFSRYLASFTYITNTILMPMLLIVVAALSFVPQFKMIDSVSLNNLGINVDISRAGVYYVLFVACISLTTTTSCGFSMEGNKIWIKRSLPISIAKMSISKICLNITLFLPGLIIAVLSCLFMMKLSGINTVILIVSLILDLIFISVLGLFFNLKFPNYEWNNEMEVVKQSLSTIITAFVSMLLISLSLIIIVFLDIKYLVVPIIVESLLILIFARLLARKRHL